MRPRPAPQKGGAARGVPGAAGIPMSSPRRYSSSMPTLRERAHRFWARHRTLFWILHSVWALATGVVVIVLARERYGFLPWVVGFMVLTWVSTLFFGRRTAADAAEEVAREAQDSTREEGEAGGRPATAADDAADEVPSAPGVLEEVTSYLTRIMYQETLFFLLPFYAYSTVWSSPNVAFLGVLGVLAVVSCLDLVFDRWLRASPVFGLVFFASVAFAGLNLVLPMLWHLAPRVATPLAAGIAVTAAAVLAWRTTSGGLAGRLRLAAAGAAFLAVTTFLPALVPPVPLRLDSAVFTRSIDRETLTPADTLEGAVAGPSLPDGLVVLVRVFAPSTIPASVSVEWRRDGELLRTSREIEVLAHEGGFRIWDALRPDGRLLPAGPYQVVLRTRGERVFGMAEIQVAPGAGARRDGRGPTPGAAGPLLAERRGALRP